MGGAEYIGALGNGVGVATGGGFAAGGELTATGGGLARGGGLTATGVAFNEDAEGAFGATGWAAVSSRPLPDSPNPSPTTAAIATKIPSPPSAK